MCVGGGNDSGPGRRVGLECFEDTGSVGVWGLEREIEAWQRECRWRGGKRCVILGKEGSDGGRDTLKNEEGDVFFSNGLCQWVQTWWRVM